MSAPPSPPDTQRDGQPDGQLVCAVDVGTSAVRAAVVDSRGTIHRAARRPRRPGQGAVTFDPAVLWNDVVHVLGDLELAEAPGVAAVSMAGHVGTVLVDRRGEPVMPGRGWADSAGVAELQRIWANDHTQLSVVGRPAITGGALPLLMWLRQHDVATSRRVHWALSPKDYLLLCLGAAGWTDGTTAGYTLALDVAERTWAVDLLNQTGIGDRCWPQIAAATQIVGAVSSDAADATGLPAGTPIAAGGPDGTVGAAAVLGRSEKVVADVAGTTDVLTTLASQLHGCESAAVTNPYLEPGQWARGGATGMTGGAVGAWSNLLGFASPAELPAEISEVMEQLPPGCDGLSISPTLTGSRFPDWHPDDTGALWGLTEDHGPAHIVRATQEAGAFVVRAGIDLLVDRSRSTLLLAGGVAKSAALAQLRADVLGMPVRASQMADASLLGAAMVGQVAAGTFDDLMDAQSAMAPATRHFAPDPDRARQYDALYAAWAETRRCLRHRRW